LAVPVTSVNALGAGLATDQQELREKVRALEEECANEPGKVNGHLSQHRDRLD
jgi:hypothetical protein